MKVLLTTLNAKYIHSNLSIKYLYMASKQYKNKVEIREFTINQPEDYIHTEIVRGSYDLICFSCYIWNIEAILQIAENIKKALPGVHILLGGPEVSYESIDMMKKNPFVDLIIRGEGEETFSELMKTLSEYDDIGDAELEDIDGLVYRKNRKIYVNNESEKGDFNNIPFPYSQTQNLDDRIVYYETVRGCPYRCSYCLSSVDKQIRALSLDRVKEDLKFFLKHKVKQVKLIDRTFNYDRKRCVEILKFISEHDNRTTNFHFEICGELINDELIEVMSAARHGLFQVEIGIQSLNRLSLEAVNRSSKIEILLDNIRKITKLEGVHVHIDLIAGLPYEDYISFRNSFNGVYNLGADQLQLGFLKLLKGTKIRREKEKYGYVFRDVAPYEIISNRFISAEGIARLKMIENVFELYFNRGGFARALAYGVSVFKEFPFDFYEEFAYFFYLKGYQNKNHKKEDLYRILYNYACWKNKSYPGMAENIKTLLTLDMKDFLNPEAIKRFDKKGWTIE